ncbi:conserved hypothetical protein [Altererythrobacter sp. B11]|uniref:lasso peptide biosynthesis B2 protein n=1 Tax=Altererythrobacter sp. B11 TaxID=2060312 RepID=UPI000DC70AFD|nr:lasso peptide biosynthesis B2 protein [Altererythrobacter sp. B11]BBC73232.1 conserved hypothetical protein [Altererythrobacter sp. B11]
MYFRVKSEFGYCTTAAGDVVLLDLIRARYFSLAKNQRHAFLRLAENGWWLDEAAPEFPVLLGLEFLETVVSSDRHNFDIEIESAEADISRTIWSVGVLPDLVQALFGQFLMSAKLRVWTLKIVLRQISNHKSNRKLDERTADTKIQRIRAGYDASEIFIGRTDRCLVRSLAMFATLNRRGINSKLVIGVRTNPFAAHCWIQRGSVVLNDVVEHVRNFTPIMVLG